MYMNTHLSWKTTAGTIDTSNNILNGIFCFFEMINALVTVQEKCNCLFSKKEYCALDTWKKNEDIDSQFYWVIQLFFVYAKQIRTQCIQVLDFQKTFNNDFFIPTLRDECSTHRKCSQIFLTCFQRNIGSFGGGDFCDC